MTAAQPASRSQLDFSSLPPALEVVDVLLSRIRELAEASTEQLSHGVISLFGHAKEQAGNVCQAVDMAHNSLVNGKKIPFQEKLEELNRVIERQFDALSREVSPELRNELTTLKDAIRARDVFYRELLDSAARAQEEAAEQMSHMVMELQFQDRVCQNAQNAQKILDVLQQAWAGKSQENLAEAIVENISLGEFRALFVQRLEARGLAVPANAAEKSQKDDAEDAIDLF